ncbi:MAG: hypothetical protein ACYS8W_02110 [Planctomycetota bacterium]|jgi:hypothetical protein
MRWKYSELIILLALLLAITGVSGCTLVGQMGKACLGFFASFEGDEAELVECPVCGERIKITTRECPVCESTVSGSSRMP